MPLIRLVAIAALVMGGGTVTAAVPLDTVMPTAPTSTPTPTPPGADWTLAFADEFNGTSIDTAVWNYRTDAKAHSAQRRENVSVDNGTLKIALRAERFLDKDFTGGGLVSKQRFRYGYYESRAKISHGPGWHSSFWLQAGDGRTTYPPEQRTEIDVFEIDSARPQATRHNIIPWRGANLHDGAMLSTYYYDIGFDLRQWHTYAVDWQEERARFYVDGDLKFDTAYPPSRAQHDYLNVWLTTIGYGDPRPDASQLPAEVQYDYVRYWQRDHYVDDDGPAAAGYRETGPWFPSSLPGWTKGTTTRYAACGTAGATATWQPTLGSAGTYEVFYRKVAHPNGDPRTRLTLTHRNGTHTHMVDASQGRTEWVSLGTHSFEAGTRSAVTLTSSGTGCARADAVKFVRS